MEMCLAWGLPPNVVESLPRDTRREMVVFYTWKNQRDRMLQEKAQMDAKG